jgi:hypothetical protein
MPALLLVDEGEVVVDVRSVLAHAQHASKRRLRFLQPPGLQCRHPLLEGGVGPRLLREGQGKAGEENDQRKHPRTWHAVTFGEYRPAPAAGEGR